MNTRLRHILYIFIFRCNAATMLNAHEHTIILENIADNMGGVSFIESALNTWTYTSVCSAAASWSIKPGEKAFKVTQAILTLWQCKYYMSANVMIIMSVLCCDQCPNHTVCNFNFEVTGEIYFRIVWARWLATTPTAKVSVSLCVAKAIRMKFLHYYGCANIG